MLYEANIYQMQVEDHIFWVAESKALKGCVGQGESSEEAIQELEVNEREWIETAKEYDIPIPDRTAIIPKNYSGKISLRVSPYVHEKAALAADQLGISVNQFINDALISYTADILNANKTTIPASNTEITSKIIELPMSDRNPYTNVVEELEEM